MTTEIPAPPWRSPTAIPMPPRPPDGIGAQQAASLAARIWDADRKRPLVVLSTGSRLPASAVAGSAAALRLVRQ